MFRARAKMYYNLALMTSLAIYIEHDDESEISIWAINFGYRFMHTTHCCADKFVELLGLIH